MRADQTELLRQQTALARFGELALTSDDLDHILTQACSLVAEGVGTELAKVMEIQADGETLLVRAGIGWKPGIVGKVTLKLTENTSEGLALRTGEPMISPDIATETRFSYPSFLTDNGVEAVANVVIIGGHGKPPFGILQVDSREPRAFSDTDIVFLRSYANLLAAAVDRLRVMAGTREGEERLRLALEAGGLGGWEIDMKHGTANRTAKLAEIFGDSAAAVGWSYESFLQHVLPEERERVAAVFSHAAETGEEWCTECRIHRANDGEIRWIETRGRAMGALGKLSTVRLLGVTADVTERVRTEERMRQGQRAIGRLTSGVAHNFNNVLQALLGGLELAMEGVAQQPEVLANMRIALEAGQRGARLTSHLLSFSRQQMLVPEALDLPPFLRQMQSTLAGTLGQDIRILVEIAPDLPRILVDAAQLDAALLNLALNARDAMPLGGDLRFEAYQSEGQVLVAVTDTGDGMSPDVLANACEPFFSTKGPKGSGLGLSMVQGFVRQSGGELRIASVVETGTRIELLLPLAPSVAMAVPKPLPAPALRLHGRVLLVEDEEQVRLVIGSFLRRAGFEVTSVINGNEAMIKLGAGPVPDLLITDYFMPGMSGGQLAQYAREIHPALAILIITGFAEADRFDHLLAGAHILRKPFGREELMSVVKRLTKQAISAPLVA